MEPEGSLPLSQVFAKSPYPKDQPRSEAHVSVCNKVSFYGEDLLAPRPTTKLEDYPLSAVRDCLLNIFAATLHIGGRSAT